MGWYFEVQAAVIAKILELPSNNWFFFQSVKCGAKASNYDIELRNLGLLHSDWVCLSQIFSTQIFIESRPIQAFSCILTMKPGGMIRLRMVWSIFPLKMIIGGRFVHLPWRSLKLSDVSFHSPKNEPHTLSPFFVIHFNKVMSKNVDVSPI